MEPALRFATSLLASVLCAFGIAALLEHVARWLYRRDQRAELAGLEPCTYPVFSPRIPHRDPNITHVGSWPLGCSVWVPLAASCKARRTGSPHV